MTDCYRLSMVGYLFYRGGVPKSRGRQPERSRKGRAASGDPRRRSADALVRELARQATGALNRALGGNLSDPLTLIAMPALFLETVVATYRDVLPAERCVDDCLVLAHAYAQFGMEAEVRIAELAVTDSVTASRAVHGSLEPKWENGMIHGHTVVWLPEHCCLVDPTAEQYEEIAAYRDGLVITTAPRPTAEDMVRVPAARGFLRLAYVLGTREASAALLDHPYVHEQGDGHLRRGVHVASEVLTRLASRRPARETAAIPCPRMAALVQAVRSMKARTDEDGFLYFSQRGPGVQPRMRLNEIPLPADARQRTSLLEPGHLHTDAS